MSSNAHTQLVAAYQRAIKAKAVDCPERKQAYIERVNELREQGLSQRQAKAQAQAELTQEQAQAARALEHARAVELAKAYQEWKGNSVYKEYSADRVRLEKTAKGGRRYRKIMPTKSSLRCDFSSEGMTRISTETIDSLKASAQARWDYLDFKAVAQVAGMLHILHLYQK